MSKKKARIEKLVTLLASNYKVNVSNKDVESGIFPWHNGKSGIESYMFRVSTTNQFLTIYMTGSVAEDYDLIDTWMLMQRYEEAIELNKKEMSMFLLSCNTTANALCDEIKRRESERQETNLPSCPLSRSQDVAQATEVHRLQQIIQKARELFLQFQEGFTFDDEENFEKAEQSEVEDYADPGHPAAIEEDLTRNNEDSEEDDGGSDEYDGGDGEYDDCCDWLNGEDCNSTSG